MPRLYRRRPNRDYLEQFILPIFTPINNTINSLGSYEDDIINILAHRTVAQRQAIERAYKEQYGEDIRQKLKSLLREDLELVILWSFYDRAHLNAAALQKAMNATETDNDLLIHVICTADRDEIRPIKEAFQEMAGTRLVEAIESKCNGDFKRVLLAIVDGSREEDCDESQARADAKELFEAGEDKIGTDESTFIRMMCNRSFKQIQLIDKYYQELSGHDLITVIEKELSGDVGKSLKLIVNYAKNKVATLSQMLNASLKGGETRSASVIRIVLAYAESDLESIKAYFDETYEQSLAEMIGAEASGDYKHFLLDIVL
ncbi:unnamed protein product [Rodentolepis nana]|uniref:Annexin n=1 Tax=Rodentolepis nana TaxID=102285 RepID=A0A0R3T0F7_RODNA|nr:unnamed protein product [Rodentolepis nana]